MCREWYPCHPPPKGPNEHIYKNIEFCCDFVLGILQMLSFSVQVDVFEKLTRRKQVKEL